MGEGQGRLLNSPMLEGFQSLSDAGLACHDEDKKRLTVASPPNEGGNINNMRMPNKPLPTPLNRLLEELKR